ncbi:MAG: hypothetical protein NC094_11200 [Bacteroidales bacterium]|nr:hypothetical protein [Lachnoclostridium sp.]MCM1385340.1 hypothetical protein [Lachnoclostridium sp.]MCM1465975.1 hypothetical protein [Bacteroidales bacterium]
MKKDKSALCIPFEAEDFTETDIGARIEEAVEEYNAVVDKYGLMHCNPAPKTKAYDKMYSAISMLSYFGAYLPNEFRRTIDILLFATVGRQRDKMIWKYGADEHAADIMGMLMDELDELSEEDYGKLMDSFLEPLDKWRALKVPKCRSKGAYALVYEIVRQCYEHKAYHTALKLAGLLYIADEQKKMPNLVKTFLLMGKILYELGYMEAAKRCFLFAGEDTDGQCLKDIPEQYHSLLLQETRLKISDKALEKQKALLDSKKRDDERKELGGKALDIYKEYEGGDLKERQKGVNTALKVFTEEPENYEAAAYLYFMAANVYFKNNNINTAYNCIKAAYDCKNGSQNGRILLFRALILGKMGRINEAHLYVFRSYLLESITDIMGMILDDLMIHRRCFMSDDDYAVLLEELAPPLYKWNALKAPECRAEGAYELMYEIIRYCHRRKAYRTAAKLSKLLYVMDDFGKKSNRAKTNILVGKILYDLGYRDIAEMCFLFADKETDGKGWEVLPERYLWYDNHYNRVKPEFVFSHPEMRNKEQAQEQKKAVARRKRTAAKALRIYQKYAQGDTEERLEGIDAAFKAFKEAPEVYEEAAYLYFLKANIYLEAYDFGSAYDCIMKAYDCKNGNKNAMVLLGITTILRKQGRKTEATAYALRAYLLLGRKFVLETLGESALEAVEKYLF